MEAKAEAAGKASLEPFSSPVQRIKPKLTHGLWGPNPLTLTLTPTLQAHHREEARREVSLANLRSETKVELGFWIQGDPPR